MKIEVFDFETEETTTMSLEEFERQFNADEINQSLCNIKFIED